MTLISFFTSLINIGTEWYMTMLYGVCLFFEGIVFEVVSIMYNLFLIVCGINLSTVSGLLSSLIDRLKAVIIVFIVFKLGVALIGYLLEPDKAQKEGTKIIINIFLTALFLISYSTIFDIFNELNLLIFGNPTKYPYTVLSTIVDVTPEENDKGLIMRFVLGDDAEGLDDVGEYLAYSTLTMFIYDYGNPSSSNNVAAIICPSTSQDGCNFMKLPETNSKIDLTIEYHPLWGFVVGAFLIYSLGGAAIAVAVRMFKIVIMQLLAPIAIVSILDGGVKAETFQKFVKKYIEVYLSAIFRLLTTLIITIFVCKFLMNAGDYVALPDSGSKWTNILVCVIVIWGGYKFMKDAPAFIESLIGAKFGGDEKTSFGQFVGGMIGGAIGGAAGIIGGAATGFASGHGLGRFTGMVGNAVAGGIGGGFAGAKGKNVAEKFKNIQGNSQAYRNRAASIGMAGGLLPYGAAKVGGFFGRPQNLIEKGQRAADRQTAMDNMIKTLEDNYDDKITINGQEVGVDRSIFNDYAYDPSHRFFGELSAGTQSAVKKTNTAKKEYEDAQGKYDQLRTNGVRQADGSYLPASEAEMAAAFKTVEASRAKYQSLKKSTDKKVDTDFNTKMIRDAREGKNIKAKGKMAVKTSMATYDHVAAHGYTTKDFVNGTQVTLNGETVTASTKTASDKYTTQQDRTTHSRAATRFNNSNYRNSSGK